MSTLTSTNRPRTALPCPRNQARTVTQPSLTTRSQLTRSPCLFHLLRRVTTLQGSRVACKDCMKWRVCRMATKIGSQPSRNVTSFTWRTIRLSKSIRTLLCLDASRRAPWTPNHKVRKVVCLRLVHPRVTLSRVTTGTLELRSTRMQSAEITN